MLETFFWIVKHFSDFSIDVSYTNSYDFLQNMEGWFWPESEMSLLSASKKPRCWCPWRFWGNSALGRRKSTWARGKMLHRFEIRLRNDRNKKFGYQKLVIPLMSFDKRLKNWGNSTKRSRLMSNFFSCAHQLKEHTVGSPKLHHLTQTASVFRACIVLEFV